MLTPEERALVMDSRELKTMEQFRLFRAFLDSDKKYSRLGRSSGGPKKKTYPMGYTIYAVRAEDPFSMKELDNKDRQIHIFFLPYNDQPVKQWVTRKNRSWNNE